MRQSSSETNGQRKAPGMMNLSSRRDLVEDWFDRFSDLFPISSRAGSLSRTADLAVNPKVDIREKDQAFVLSAELPGMRSEDISLEVHKGIISISGEKHYESSEDKQDENYHLTERSFGYFKRSFSLPDNIEEDKIIANFKDGVLTVEMPKSEKPNPSQRKIAIQG